MAVMSSEIEQLQQNIDNTIRDATNLLEQAKQHLKTLETKGYIYELNSLPIELGQEVIQFILFCRLIDTKKAELEKLKTEITPENINAPNPQETNFSQDLPKSEESTSKKESKNKEESTMNEEENEDWAAEADAEEKEKIARGEKLFDPVEFAKSIQLDINKPKINTKSVNAQYQELANSIKRLEADFPKNKESSIQKIVDKETAIKMLFSPAMLYLKKRQAEAKEQTPVSDTPTAPSSDPKR